MMKVLFILTLLVFFPFFAKSQILPSTEIDSIKSLIHNNRLQDTVKAEALLDLAFLYRNVSVDSAKNYSVQSLEFSRRIGYQKGEAQALRNIGLSYLRAGKFDTAVTLVKTAIVTAKKNDIKTTLADCYNTLGTAFYRLAKYDSANYYYEESAKLYKTLDRAADVAGAFLNIGSIYNTQGNTIKALQNFQESLLVFEELNHQQGIAAATYNLSGIFSDQGDFKKAIYYLARTAKIDSASNNLQGYAESLGQLGSFYLELDNSDSAIDFFQKAISITLSIGSNCYIVNSASQLGELYLDMNSLDSAFYYLQFAASTAEKCKLKKEIVTSYLSLSEYYTKTGKINLALEKLHIAYDIASKNQLTTELATASSLLYQNYKILKNEHLSLKYLEEFDSLERALFNIEKTRKIAQIEAEYILEKERQKYEYEKELSDIAYQEKLDADHRQLIYLISIAVIFIIVILVLWRMYHQKSKYSLLLGDQNNQIKKQSNLLENKAQLLEQKGEEIKAKNEHLLQINKEKNTIIGIVAHDLKNPLNQIKGIIEIIKLEGYNQESIKNNLVLIEDAAERSVLFIDRILDISAAENKQIIVNKDKINLNELLKAISDSFKTSASSKNIQLNLLTNEVISLNTDALLLREAVENLISNAIKFSPINSEVDIQLTANKTYYKIIISDQGPGIKPEDRDKMFNEYQKLSAKPTANEKSSGLGLAIVRRNIDALGYTIAVNTEREVGAEFIIQIPISIQ